MQASLDAIPLPRFRPRAPWWGPDLQTLRSALMGPALGPPKTTGERLELPLDDGSGDTLAASLERPSHPRGHPLAVLIHGLSGSEDSAYVVTSARVLLERGYPVLRLNLRGAGPSRPLCRLQYHAGRTADLRDALAALDPALTAHGLVLVGYSLGANMLLKFLAEYAAQLPILGAAAVSAPIDLRAASYRFLAPRNRFYHWNLLRNMKRESLSDGAVLSAQERRAIESVSSILEFDEHFVAPRNGYAGAEEYYAANMARRFLAQIVTPTLVIHSRDDPWIPAEAYTSYPWRDNPNLRAMLSDSGGHVGFHGHGSLEPWHDRCAADFFAALVDRRASAAG